jgi:hypothetical protein
MPRRLFSLQLRAPSGGRQRRELPLRPALQMHDPAAQLRYQNASATFQTPIFRKKWRLIVAQVSSETARRRTLGRRAGLFLWRRGWLRHLLCGKRSHAPASGGAERRRPVQIMVLIIPLVLIFWVIVPGLLTGWMLREHGRHFLWGLLLGALFGPAGILAALAFIFVTKRRPTRLRPHEQSRGFRSFYIVPFVGRLHVSTAWSLAGVVAFLCAWMIGGLSYELYTARYSRATTNAGRAAKPEANQQVASAAGNVAPNQLQEVQKPTAHAQSGHPTPPGGPLLSGLAAQTGQSAQVSGSGTQAPAQAGQTPTGAPPNVLAAGATPVSPAAPSATAPPAPQPPPPTPARAPAQAREAAVSEVMRGLGGHRVHVAVSGDTQTATLSVSGPTLTRQVGNQLVSRTRQSLKAAGIRIVVMNNGPESWTYIL